MNPALVFIAFIVFVFVVVSLANASGSSDQKRILTMARFKLDEGDVRGTLALLLRDPSALRDETDHLRLLVATRFAADGHFVEAKRLLSIVEAHIRVAEQSPQVSGSELKISRAFDRAERSVQESIASARAREDAPHAPAAEAPAPAGPIESGRVIGPYALEGLIAEGGFGQVWRARELLSGAAVALKIPTRQAYVDVLRLQGVIQSRLRDPRIVSILGSDLHATPPYIAMELVEGEDLRAILRREKRLEPARAALLLGEILRAVAVAHAAGVVHRDLKPENVIVAAGDRVKVTDFGLGAAREHAERPLLRSGGLDTGDDSGVAGTPAYMAPEQLAGSPVDARADVYALGVLFFEMLTGERPQPGDRPSDLVPTLPAEHDAVFARCYTRLEKRFADAQEMLEALSARASAAA